MKGNLHYKTLAFCSIIILGVCAIIWEKFFIIIPVAIVFVLFSLYKKLFGKYFGIILLLIFSLTLFYTNARIPEPDSLIFYENKNVTLYGKVVSLPEKNLHGKTKFDFDVETISLDGISNKKLYAKTLVYLPKENNITIQRGNTLKLNAFVFIPQYYGNEGEFDYAKYLKNFNIYTLTFVNDVEILNAELTLKEKFFQLIDAARSEIIKKHSKYLSQEKLEILGGVVFGSEAIKPSIELKNIFIESGLYHLLAASGMNVAFIFGIWFFLLSFLKIPYKLIIISGGIIVLLYALMTGLPPSVVRATWMLELALLGKMLDRNSDNNVILLFICAFLLIYNPLMLNDIGFLLSFVVTFGLINCAPPLIESFKIIPTKISSWFVIPFIAQIFAIPIQIYYFQTISLYSILANMMVIPFMALVSFCGFISSIFALIHKIGSFICMILDKINEPFLAFMLFIAEKFSQIPNNIAHMARLNAFEILVYYILIFLLIYMLKIKFKNIKLNIAAILLFVYLLCSFVLKGYSNELSFTFLNVGEGDSIFIQTPQGKKMLVDTGRYYSKTRNSGNSIIIPFLRANCVDKIDILLLTHPDNDHIGGSFAVFENIEVDKIYSNGEKGRSKTFFRLEKYIENNNIERHIVKDVRQISLDNQISIMAIKPKETDKTSQNDTSIILHFKYKDFDALLMGDNEINSYEELKKNLDPNGEIELFKLGHHGSKNSINKKMADFLSPKITIVSVGKNDYGHPNKRVLNHLRRSNVFRTDIDNSIKIKTNGIKYDLYTYNSKKSCWIKRHLKN